MSRVPLSCVAVWLLGACGGASGTRDAGQGPGPRGFFIEAEAGSVLLAVRTGGGWTYLPAAPSALGPQPLVDQAYAAASDAGALAQGSFAVIPGQGSVTLVVSAVVEAAPPPGAWAQSSFGLRICQAGTTQVRVAARCDGTVAASGQGTAVLSLKRSNQAVSYCDALVDGATGVSRPLPAVGVSYFSDVPAVQGEGCEDLAFVASATVSGSAADAGTAQVQATVRLSAQSL